MRNESDLKNASYSYSETSLVEFVLKLQPLELQ